MSRFTYHQLWHLNVARSCRKLEAAGEHEAAAREAATRCPHCGQLPPWPPPPEKYPRAPDKKRMKAATPAERAKDHRAHLRAYKAEQRRLLQEAEERWKADLPNIIQDAEKCAVNPFA